MSISSLEPLATKVTFDSENMWVQLADGRSIGVPLAYFPRLAKASSSDRKKYVISGGGIGLHWELIDEDISVPALLQGKVDRTVKLSRGSKRVA